MLLLKEVNTEDLEQEYAFFSELLEDENGFTYSHVGASFEEFSNEIVPMMMANAKGEKLPEGFVPCTEYLLWDDDRIVGLFRMRHVLNDFLRQYHGHIGYMIRRSERGKGYGSRGLQLLLDLWRDRIDEAEFYLSVHRDNPASLQVQKNCGAYVHHMDEECFYTRIPKTDYDLLVQQAKGFCDAEPYFVPLLSNISALIAEEVPTINWAGFYLMREKKDGGEELVLGPFQGKTACIRIQIGKGVCGTAVATGTTQRIEDVHQFPGHIACDAASNSEIVIPLYKNNKIFGVLDIDSPVTGRFRPEDQTGLEALCQIITDAIEL